MLPPWRALVVPASLVVLALAAQASGLDLALADRFFDVGAQRFAWRSNLLLEAIGHQFLKSLAVAVWALLATATIGATLYRPRPHLWRLLAATTLAMALGPLIVVLLKSTTSFPCPWSLARYGGLVHDAGSHWFTVPSRSGHCFPSGHAAGGFSFIAIAFGLNASGQRRAAGVALAMAIAIGSASAAVRMVQGAHFLSHCLWAAAIDWLATILVFRSGIGPGTWQQSGKTDGDDLAGKRQRRKTEN